ncbi:response regulator [Pseudoalteromonas rubra]|uniref:response regulator n=1 Tax=Pseudoalteromonas rubra TaxID=43658 RepID=UPI0013DDFC42|nr:response regulator [Pseudoalteromonas rubra]
METILIVDDDEFVLEYHNHMLSSKYLIREARSGEDALQAAQSGAVDLVLMDIQMPGMSGYEAAYKLRMAGHTMPILFFSNLNSLDERLKAYDAGGNDFIAKPVDEQELHIKVSALLKSHKARVAKPDDAEDVAVKALSALSSLGIVMGFYRDSFHCHELEHLAESVFNVTRGFGLKCSLIIRSHNTSPCFFDDGVVKNIDAALLESLHGASRIMAFGKHRAAFNWRRASLLVKNMPEDPEMAGTMRDYLAYVMDGMEQCINRVLLEQQLRQVIRQFKTQNTNIKNGIVGLIDDLETQLESLFCTLSIDNELSEEAEQQLLNMIQAARASADTKLQSGKEVERQLTQLIATLDDRAASTNSADIELF